MKFRYVEHSYTDVMPVFKPWSNWDMQNNCRINFLSDTISFSKEVPTGNGVQCHPPEATL